MCSSLRSLSNCEILSRTRALVARERGITIEVLLHLGEVERRELYLEAGYGSMFYYCTSGLGYSTSGAKRRLCAARCIAEFPRALELLQSNDINLSTILQVARLLTPETGATILDRIRNKSQREVEAIAAEYEPLAALPRDRAKTVVVRIPVTPSATPDRRQGWPEFHGGDGPRE